MSLRSELITKFEAVPKNQKHSLVARFVPSERERGRLIELTRDFGRGDLVRNQGYEEFNHKSLMDVTNRDRKVFNNYVPPKSSDPDEAWKANTMRPISRNKVISIAAHITSSLLFPQIFAQNEGDDEDKAASMVMRDLSLWSNEQSDYAEKFVKGVVKALVDPAMIMYEGYAEVTRKIKEIQANGEWTEKEILDELYSGFQNMLVPVEELYIGNVYESDIQKQPFLIWRRVITYEEAKVKYQDSPNFSFVDSGLKFFYSDASDGFYEMHDDSLEDGLVEELIYFNRYSDLELPLLNGIPMSDPDRPLQRTDKKLPFAKTGYEYFGGTDFFYYKSLVDKLSSDQEVIDTLYNMIIDASFLQVMPPSVMMGDDELDSAVVVPGGVTALSEDSKFQTIDTKNNLNAGLVVMQKVEASVSESSTAPLQAGQDTGGTPATAFEISRQESNAKTVLGLFGKMIAQWVEEFGRLRCNTILQHMTVAQSSEVVGDASRLRFRKFLLPASEAAPGPTKKIEFDMDTPDTEEGVMEMSFALMEEEVKKGVTIAKVNPELFRRNKFLFKVKADFMPAQSEAVKKSLNLEAYDRAVQNPLLDQEKVTADFLIESYRPGESDKYMKKAGPEAQQIQGGNSNMTSQILNKSEAKATA